MNIKKMFKKGDIVIFEEDDNRKISNIRKIINIYGIYYELKPLVDFVEIKTSNYYYSRSRYVKENEIRLADKNERFLYNLGIE